MTMHNNEFRKYKIEVYLKLSVVDNTYLLGLCRKGISINVWILNQTFRDKVRDCTTPAKIWKLQACCPLWQHCLCTWKRSRVSELNPLQVSAVTSVRT